MHTTLRRDLSRGIGALLLAAACASTAFAQTATELTKKGAIVDTKITTELNSKTSHNGDPFSMTIVDGLFHHHPELKGAVVDGHLEDVTPASATHKATMNVIFDDITFADGRKEPVSVAVAKMSTLEPKTHHIRDVALIVGGAVTGHIVSKKTGHGGGTLAGAAAGFALASSMKSDIDIKPGTMVQLRFLRDVDAPVASQT